ncbi:PREDICTED: heat shock transcription factor, Y-linked-like [Nipponia nippon]|uniref:heat shock transcription factor, Y-linked-like n=1 Tax=Nipponia nippon TaxID=128390 RepID=UPI000510EA30|nr:PREDICTED: heat shock transcription factor, Y-linked-like [Nipponia nippon]
MASTEQFTQTEKREFKMELSSQETSCASAQAKGVDLPGSTPLRPARGKRAANDAAFGPPREERALQTSAKRPQSKRERLSSSEESSSDTWTRLSFLKKLWDIVESHQFESIWWGDNGKCVVIHEELFKDEVLARRGYLRIFESETMRSFTHRLHLYGFARKLCDFPKSGSHDDLLAEETAGEFHFYYNPNFRRHCLHLLVKCKRSSSPKNQTPAGFSPDTDLHARRRKRKPDAELAWEPAAEEEESAPFTAAPRENTHASAPSKTAPAKRPAKHSSPGPAASQGAACAAASPRTALSMPGPPGGHAPPYRHCPGGTWAPNKGAAGNGLGPQPGPR